MNNNNWFIESISLVKTVAPPTKEEMEKLLPSSWPSGWEEIDRYSKDGVVTVSLAHINPDPEYELGVAIMKTGSGVAVAMPSIKPEKFDYVGNLSIAGYGDKQTARQFFESHQTIPTQGLAAPTPGTSMGIPLGDLIKAFVPKDMVKELESGIEEYAKGRAESGIEIEKGKYLGEEALFPCKGGKRLYPTAVLINNFVIEGSLLMSEGLEPGSKRIHAIGCKLSYLPSSKHPPCSTLKAEGFLHKEGMEQINRSIFSKIKGEKEEVEEVNVEITRRENKIKSPKEKSRIENGDTINTNKTTQVNLADSVGNKMWIGGGSKVKIDETTDFELLLGSVTAFIKSLKVKGKFEVHTPPADGSVRGTIFSVWTDGQTTSLTVVEGEVEFSDLKGSKVIVKSNQCCICSKEQGVQKPITLPINLKEQFKEK